MRKEMQFIIKNAVKKELQKRTKAHIWITFKDDDMCIELTYLQEKFVYYEYNMMEKLYYGIHSKTVVDNVIKAYKKHILSKYFL